jgi:hypothetical protein
VAADGEMENPRTGMKNERKERVARNEGKRVKNAGEESAVKKSVGKAVVTKKLAQRLRKSRVGKTLGGRTGRRR